MRSLLSAAQPVEVRIPCADGGLPGDLSVPAEFVGLVVFVTSIVGLAAALMLAALTWSGAIPPLSAVPTFAQLAHGPTLLLALLLGCVLGTIGFIRIAAWSAFSNVYGPHWMLVALTVAFSLVGIVTWGTLSGSMLPFVLKRLGFDPATSSAPFVATLVDVTGLIIYFTVALVVLRGTLL